MFKLFIVLSALVALSVSEKSDFFTTNEDLMDIDEVMRNPLRVMGLVECFLDRAPCSSFDESYKKIIPETIDTGCHRCTNAQKHWWNRFLLGLKAHYPYHYEEFQQKFDPSGIFLSTLESLIAEF